jgi:hypothetical protein
MDADVTDGRGSDLCLSARSVKIRGPFLLVVGLAPRCAPFVASREESHFWRHDSYSLRGRRLVVVFDAPGLSRRDISLRKLERTVISFASNRTTTTRLRLEGTGDSRWGEALLRWLATNCALAPGDWSLALPAHFCNSVHSLCIAEGAALFTAIFLKIFLGILVRESCAWARMGY